MMRRLPLCSVGWLLPSIAALVLAACGSDDASTPADAPPPAGTVTVAVESLPTGAHVAVLGSDTDPRVVKYYAAADGSRLVVAADGDERATTVYRRAADGAWVAIPAPERDVAITFRRHDPLVAAAVDVATLAGRYRVRLADGSQAAFTLNAAGALAAGTTTCRITGAVSSSGLPGAAAVTVATSGCSLPASASGALIVDADYRPASFRLVLDDQAAVVDLWAFAD